MIFSILTLRAIFVQRELVMREEQKSKMILATVFAKLSLLVQDAAYVLINILEKCVMNSTNVILGTLKTQVEPVKVF